VKKKQDVMRGGEEKREGSPVVGSDREKGKKERKGVVEGVNYEIRTGADSHKK